MDNRTVAFRYIGKGKWTATGLDGDWDASSLANVVETLQKLEGADISCTERPRPSSVPSTPPDTLRKG